MNGLGSRKGTTTLRASFANIHWELKSGKSIKLSSAISTLARYEESRDQRIKVQVADATNWRSVAVSPSDADGE